MKTVFCQLIFFISFRIVNSVAVICYYTASSVKNGLVPEILDSNLCTHINYAFVDVWDNGSLKIKDHKLEIEQGLFIRVTDLKEGNPNLKTLLSVGEDSQHSNSLFSSIVKNSGKRRLFIESVTKFILEFNFNGLDITWKYPRAKEREAYTTLLRELKHAFRPRGWLLTAAVAANPTDGYDISEMKRNLDIVNVMSFDYDGSWSSYVNQNITTSANNWLKAGLPKDKLVIGVELYGRLFTLSDQKQLEHHTPVDYEVQSETVDFSTICSSYKNWTRVWDDKLKNPYKYQENHWMGYNDKDSISAKVSWIKSQDLFGVMVWTITGDDVKGQCGEEQILLKQTNKALK